MIELSQTSIDLFNKIIDQPNGPVTQSKAVENERCRQIYINSLTKALDGCVRHFKEQYGSNISIKYTIDEIVKDEQPAARIIFLANGKQFMMRRITELNWGYQNDNYIFGINVLDDAGGDDMCYAFFDAGENIASGLERIILNGRYNRRAIKHLNYHAIDKYNALFDSIQHKRKREDDIESNKRRKLIEDLEKRITELKNL